MVVMSSLKSNTINNNYNKTISDLEEKEGHHKSNK